MSEMSKRVEDLVKRMVAEGTDTVLYSGAASEYDADEILEAAEVAVAWRLVEGLAADL